MNILVFDTSTEALAVGAAREGGPLRFRAEGGFRHAETLLPTIEACLADASLALEELDLIACAKGPGSFMGLRIGMATAKGLSLALGIPWVGVPTLDMMAYGRGGADGVVVPVLDARKNRLYAAIYRAGARQGEYLDISIEGLLRAVEGEAEVTFAGIDADLLQDYTLERPGFRVEGDDPGLRMRGLAELAERQFIEKGAAAEDEGPLYLREPEIG
ncbi:tRNA (adenosine(37)-N6)-threonylcarbamoyltransferase complex dimerization subunit type 1 TsaB [bacterium]|nr:tRNA (adenosine(37)-N6)-threonylcarbamoyltransferase complex dimerization subunit type 1 TsaB [bacterium]